MAAGPTPGAARTYRGDAARPAPRCSEATTEEERTLAEGLIVVGVDSSEASREALRWAVDEARLREARLRVVHAWWVYPMGAADDPPDRAELLLGSDPEVAVMEFVTETFGGEPDVDVEIVPAQGRQASAALIEAAKDADLLVVGSRGAGGFTGLLLGSVSEQVTHHAPCPVVIVKRSGSDTKQP